MIQEENGCQMLIDIFLLRVAAMSEESGGRLLIFPRCQVTAIELCGLDQTCKVGGMLDDVLELLSENKLKSYAREFPPHPSMPVTTSYPSGA